MAIPKKNNIYAIIIKELFNKYDIPIDRPEYQEMMEQGEKLSVSRFGTLSILEKSFEQEVLRLAERIRIEEREAVRRDEGRAKALKIASERNIAPVKLNNSRVLMSLPFFSPDRNLRKLNYEYSSPDGSVKLKVMPCPELGAAKVWDGDVLMYALSKGVKAYLETKEFPRVICFSAYEYLKQAGKKAKSGKNQADLKEQIQRLAATRYKCSLINPQTGKEKGGGIFSLCEAQWINDEQGNIYKIQIVISDTLFDYFASKNDLLSLKQGLLLEAWREERSGLKKRLLMLVGTHLGNQNFWRVGLRNLKDMCGYRNEMKYFKREFQRLMTSLPWKVDIEENREGQKIVCFRPKEEE